MSYQEPCRQCGSSSIVEVRSEGCSMCSQCGLVLDTLYEEHESFYAGNDGAVSMLRHGAPLNPLLLQSSLSTMMQFSHKFRRMKQIHDRLSMNYTERALYHAFNHIARVMDERLHLPRSAVEIAKEMYRDTKEKRISRGLIHKALTAACVYFACKVHGNIKLTKQEVSDAFEVTTAKLNKACKIFRDLTKDKPYFASMFDEIHVSDIAVRMVGKLAWESNDDKWNVIKVVRAMDGIIDHYGSLDNKHINSVMAALIYISATELGAQVVQPSSSPSGAQPSRLTKSAVSAAYDVTLITLNKTIREVEKVIEQHAACSLQLRPCAAAHTPTATPQAA